MGKPPNDWAHDMGSAPTTAMKAFAARLCATTLSVFLAASCASSTYVPKQPCVYHHVQLNGMPHLFRDGRAYPSTPTGDVYGLVQEVPAARQYAAAAQSASSTFWVMYLGGLTAIAVSPFAIIAGQEQEQFDVGAARISAATGLLILGTALSMAGVYQLTRASALRLDAINAFNDEMVRTGRCRPDSAAFPQAVPLPQRLPASSTPTFQ